MVEAIGLPCNKLCTYCWNGKGGRVREMNEEERQKSGEKMFCNYAGTPPKSPAGDL